MASKTSACSDTGRRFGVTLSDVGDKVKEGVSSVVVPIGCVLKSTALHVTTYIKENWKKLLIYFIAYAFIINLVGFMYGYSLIAKPLTLGIAGGLVVGILSGIFTVKYFSDEATKKSPQNTLWGLISSNIKSLDDGTRMLMFSLMVTVAIIAIPYFPWPVGIFLGLLIGNHHATRIGYGEPTEDPSITLVRDVQQLRNDFDSLAEQHRQLGIRLQRAQQLHLNLPVSLTITAT